MWVLIWIPVFNPDFRKISNAYGINYNEIKNNKEDRASIVIIGDKIELKPNDKSPFVFLELPKPNVDYYLLVDGVGTGTDTYHRIDSVTGRDSISIARTTGDPVITSDNYAFITAPSVAFTGVGNTITATGHGLAVGNKFRVIGINTNNVGDYIVGVSTLTNKFEVTGGIGAASGVILKHGLSSNAGVSDRTNENLQARAITIFDGETLTLTVSGGINANSTTTSFSSSLSFL